MEWDGSTCIARAVVSFFCLFQENATKYRFIVVVVQFIVYNFVKIRDKVKLDNAAPPWYNGFMNTAVAVTAFRTYILITIS